MKIIVDAMGGDNAPESNVLGAFRAAKEFGIDVCLVGRGEEILETTLKNGYGELPKEISIVNAGEVIDMHDDPSTSIREKKDSSIVVGLKMLADGDGDAFVSAGSTGALLAGSTLIVKRIKGIRRAAFPPVLPAKNGKFLLIDCGANVECTPEYLLQFAYMGNYYAKTVMKIAKPRIGLLNIGVEETKGTQLQKDTYELLQKAAAAGQLDFVGNVEGRDVMFGICDVVVSDGYSGNIMLKSIEGVGLFFVDTLKGIFKKNLVSKIAALLVKSGIGEIKKILDYNETGGSPLLGIAKPVVKAHGSANEYTIRSAIKQAVEYAESNIIKDLQNNVEFWSGDGRE